MDNFVNLHVHTISSLQDSVIKINELLSVVDKYEQSAVAITDHSSCASWVAFNNECQNYNQNIINQYKTKYAATLEKPNLIKPIFGNEFYCWPLGINKSKDRDHLVLLAMNEDGLINIRRLQRLAVENSYYKPILKYEFLKENPTNGIYCTSACSLSSISKALLNKNKELAIEYAEFFYDIFDGNFSLECQFHPDYSEQNIINEGLVEVSDKTDIPLTVSCDAHFIDNSNRDLRKIIQCIAWKKQYDDENMHDSLISNCVGNSSLVMDFAIKSNFSYMHTVQNMIKQTNKIASMCNAELEEPERRTPNFNKYEEFNKLFDEVEW